MTHQIERHTKRERERERKQTDTATHKVREKRDTQIPRDGDSETQRDTYIHTETDEQINELMNGYFKRFISK